MTAEIQPYDAKNDRLTVVPSEAPTITYAGSEMIHATARALADAHNIGSALCRTAFVPKHFQGKPDDAAAAILYGSSINMDPITALQNIFVIGGKPALYARSMVAVVMSKGHKIWTEDESEGSVTVCGQRKGSDHIERVTWTTEMAKRAGYDSNAKYRTDPRSMLYARASGDVARRIAPDALLGMAHNVEELTIDRVEQTPAAKPQGMAALKAAVAESAEPEPQADPETGEVTDDDQADPRYWRKRMFALFSERGIGDADEQRRGISHIVERDISSRSQVTEGDARAVVEHLTRGPQ